MTMASCAYVARYVMKKVTGAKAAEHYVSVDVESGEVSDLLPEYITMSLKPAIGERWFAKFPEDFELFELGTFDDETGTFACGVPASLGRGSSFKE